VGLYLLTKRNELEVRVQQQPKKNGGVQSSLFTLDNKDAFRQIRNYLAGRFVGATRDEILLKEVLKCLFCKVYLKGFGDDLHVPEETETLAERYRHVFAELRSFLPAVFDDEDELLLDPTSLAYVDEVLETMDISGWDRDPFGDAYEAFMGSHARGQEGQFFTPLYRRLAFRDEPF
jgi:type I restriction enzyme M protein